MTIKLMRPKDGSGSPIYWGQWDPFSTPLESMVAVMQDATLPPLPESPDSEHPNEELGLNWEIDAYGTFMYGMKYNSWEPHGDFIPVWGYEERLNVAVSVLAGLWVSLTTHEVLTNDDLFDDWEEVQP